MYVRAYNNQLFATDWNQRKWKHRGIDWF